MFEAAMLGAYIAACIAAAAVALAPPAEPPKDIYTYGDPAAVVETADAPVSDSELPGIIVTD